MLQSSTDNQTPMLEPTKINVSYWHECGHIARMNGQPRERCPTHVDLLASNAWLDGWDSLNRKLLIANGFERCKAAREAVAKRNIRFMKSR